MGDTRKFLNLGPSFDGGTVIECQRHEKSTTVQVHGGTDNFEKNQHNMCNLIGCFLSRFFCLKNIYNGFF